MNELEERERLKREARERREDRNRASAENIIRENFILDRGTGENTSNSRDQVAATVAATNETILQGIRATGKKAEQLERYLEQREQREQRKSIRQTVTRVATELATGIQRWYGTIGNKIGELGKRLKVVKRVDLSKSASDNWKNNIGEDIFLTMKKR